MSDLIVKPKYRLSHLFVFYVHEYLVTVYYNMNVSFGFRVLRHGCKIIVKLGHNRSFYPTNGNFGHSDYIRSLVCFFKKKKKQQTWPVEKLIINSRLGTV